MKLKIEDWVINQKFSNKVEILFEESFKSYKASAYRASLIFSYLGFMTVLKERILKANPPVNFTLEKWSYLKEGINKTDTWDTNVYNHTQNKSNTRVFQIQDSLRTEVTYWKDRRNDCAHFKHENITYSHVESFWSFLEANLAKFSVVGSKNDLLNKIIKHFDISFTSPSTDLTPLVNEIGSSVPQFELKEFYKDIYESIEDPFDNKCLVFFNAILDKYSSYIADELIELLKINEEILLDFIRKYPNRITLLNLDNVFIRKLWYDKLFYRRNPDFPLYVGLLRNNLIPEEEIADAHERVLNRILINPVLPTREFLPILNEKGFIKALKKELFPINGIFEFSKANKYSTFIYYYINDIGLDLEIVSSLISTFSNKLAPFDLQMKLSSLSKNRPDLIEKFNSIIQENNLPNNILDFF